VKPGSPIKFSMVLGRRPRSLQRKRSNDRYRDEIRNLAKTKMNGAPILSRVSLYTRILWLRRHKIDIDVDNIVKPILDALEGIVFADDTLISQCMVTRIDLDRSYEIIDAGAPTESYRELLDLLKVGASDIIYIEVGEYALQRLVFGRIDGGAL